MSKLFTNPEILGVRDLRMLAAAAAMIVAGACEDDPNPAPPDAAPPDAAPPDAGSSECVQGVPTDPPLWPKGCEHEFCPPDSVSFDIVTPQGESLPCRTAIASPCAQQTDEGGFFYRYKTDDAELVLGFSPELGSDFSEAGMREHFGALELYRLPVGETPTPNLSFELNETIRDLAQLEDFQFANGRVTATLRFDLEKVSYNLLDVDPDCVEGDIILPCTCEFTGLRIPTVINLDLALEPIPAPDQVGQAAPPATR